jgi:DNA-binding transcriptional LysR family regulator
MGSICYNIVPMKDPVETSELLAFSTTVDAKSLSKAAALLGVPRATVSRRLQRLEERLGVRLLRRTTRSLALTDAGDALYRHARIVLDAVSHAEASVRRTDTAIRGDLRVSVPPIHDRAFTAMLCEFARTHPDVRLQVHFSTRHVDLLRDGYDVAIRAGSHFEPGFVARTLVRGRLVAVASAGYLAAHGTPRTRKDLRQHRCLMGFARGEVPQTHWPFGKDGIVHVEGAFFSNEITMLADAAVNGLGIALLPEVMAGPLLAEGLVEEVLAGQIGGETRVAVVYPEREFVPPQVRAFVDAVVAWGPSGFGPRVVEKCKETIASDKARRGAPLRAAADSSRASPRTPRARRPLR